MGLLSKALLYREELLKTAPKGLLYKALKYLESKNSSFPEINGSDVVIIDEKTDTNPLFDLHFSNDEKQELKTSEAVLLDNGVMSNEQDFSVDLKNDADSYEEINLEENISIPDEIKEHDVEIVEYDHNDKSEILTEEISDEQSNIDEDVLSLNDEFKDEQIIDIENKIIDDDATLNEDEEEKIIYINEEESTKTISDFKLEDNEVEIGLELKDSDIIDLDDKIKLLNENDAINDITKPGISSSNEIENEEIILIKEHDEMSETNLDLETEINNDEMISDLKVSDEYENVGEETISLIDDKKDEPTPDFKSEVIENNSISSVDVFDVLENVEEDNLDNGENQEIKPSHTNIYFDVINDISKEMSKLIVDDQAYKKFSEILSNNFKFGKSALMIYFPPKQKFILWNGNNLDDESSAKLYFDLEFNNIYKNLSKEKSFYIKNDDKLFNDFSSLFSEFDFNDTNFILWIPFIFSARIIGIYLGLKINDRKYPSEDMISSLEIIGRLNGPLLYNLYQQETIRQQQQKISAVVEKKNYQEEEIIPHDKDIVDDPLSNDLLDEYDRNQTDNIIVQLNEMEEIENPVSITDNETAEEKIEIPESELKEVDLFDIFPENIHKLIYFAEQTIANSPESPLTLIHIMFENNDEIQNLIPNFRFETFYSDIQFVIMNVVGTNGFVQILRDMNIYIVLPEIKKTMARDLLNEITNQLKNMFQEIHENVEIMLKNNIINYPDDAKDYLDLFYKIQKL